MSTYRHSDEPDHGDRLQRGAGSPQPSWQEPPERRSTAEDEVILAELVEGVTSPSAFPHGLPRRRRRVLLPVLLFLATCLCTFWVGSMQWMSMHALNSADTGMAIRRAIVANWDDGLIYMTCLMGILLAHEMGHFLATVRYRIPASLPYFLPLPNTIGTLGAVIGMDGLRADRRQMFDIGLAGPLAGLVIAIPVFWIGIARLDLTQPAVGPLGLDSPLAVRVLLDYVQPPGYTPGQPISLGQIRGNPFFMAGWVGFLITGLNMLPVSQLDGGHVIYTLFGKRAHWIARLFVVAAFVFIFWAGAWIWIVMLTLVLLIGTDHPPTSNDRMPLGWPRRLIGYASLLIPILCFPPLGLTIKM